MRIVAHLEQKNAKEAFADKNLFLLWDFIV